VQSYGSLIYGDISRKQPMTIVWPALAQSLTKTPMKGMQQDRSPSFSGCRQIALAIRDEVSDLEAAGIGVIQI